MTTPPTPGNGSTLTPDDQNHQTGLLSLAADWLWRQDRRLRITRLRRTRALDADFLAAIAGGTFEDAGWLPLDDENRRLLAAAVEHVEPYRDVILGHASGRYISISGMPVRNDQGEWQGYQGLATDVTDSQRQQIERRWLSEVLNASPDVIMVADGRNGRLVYANETACERLGLTHEELLALPNEDLAGLTDDELMALHKAVRASGKSGLVTERQFRRSADGTRRGWWEPHWRAVHVDGREFMITVSREVSRQVLSEREAERAKRMYATLSATNEAIMRLQSPEELYQAVCDAATSEGGFSAAGVLLPQPGTDTARIAAFRGAGAQILRDTPVSLDANRTTGQGLVGTAYRTGRPAVSDDHSEDSRTTPWHHDVQAAGVKSVAAIPIQCKNRIVGVLLLSAREKRAFDPEVIALLERMSANIGFALTLLEHETERRRAEEQVRFLANHDTLTGLPNRMLFHELLAEALETAQTDQTGIGVMFLDLDRFKIINDSLGHSAGDKLLQIVAERLKACMRESDVIARLGGDEFVVLLRDVDRRSDIATVAERILAATRDPIMVDGQECRISASVGVALYPDHADDESRLMKFADIAMYSAKEDGRNAWRLYAPSARAEPSEPEREDGTTPTD